MARPSRIIFCLFSLTLSTAGVNAAVVTWVLQGVTFEDGGTASGSFSYDRDSNSYSNIDITTTPGTKRTGAHYGFIANGFGPDQTGALYITSLAANQTGHPGLALFFSPVLSNSGGTASLTGSASQEANCADPGCMTPTDPFRAVTSGTVLALVPATITKVFSDSQTEVLGGSSTSLSFTIVNPAANPVALTGIGFNDVLPAGLVVSTPSIITGACGAGTVTADAGSSNISLSGAMLPSGASCTFAVQVSGAAIGVWTVTTSQVASTNGGNGGTASATIAVDDLSFSWFFAH